MEKQEEQEIKQKGLAALKGVFDNKAAVTANQITTILKNGEADPVYVAVVLKKFAKIQELINKDNDVKELILEEIKKHMDKGGKTAKLFGASITAANTGYWDYSSTDDPYLNSMEEIKKELEILIKARKEEIEAKAKVFHNRKVEDVIAFGVGEFNLSYDRLPRLEWDEGIEVISTNPPVQKGHETLRFSV